VTGASMRICLVYDCLFPHTVGGAERWYRRLAERLAAEGHEVTYLTLRQWDRGVDPGVEGVRVVTVGPRMALYVHGRRRILPPLVFGLGVLWHLLRHGRRYDAVHTCSFPYFSLLAAALVRPLRRYVLVVDWFEVWSRDYWRRYLGAAGGLAGWAVQRLCMRPRQRAFCFSRLHARRLREQGFAHPLDVLPGIYAGPTGRPRPEPAEPVVVFAGRHIPEKRVPALVPAVAHARERVPELRAEIYGDGPDRPAVLAAIAAAGLDGAVSAPGFVESDVLEHALARALCMVLPSEREGFGLVVVEACSHGVPAVVAEAPDNAATELVDDGVNGAVARSAEPADLADAIVRVHAAGPALRESTAEWFADRGAGLSLDRSLAAVVESYLASARS
jgi:glycosyltransferase involved in cell wall biosynthesis